MRLVVGVGLNSRAEASEVVRLIAESLEEAGLDAGAVAIVASSERKAGSPVLDAVAGHFGAELRFIADADLRAVEIEEPSQLALASIGLESVAEAAVRSFGRLVLGKRKSSNATCAIGSIAP